MNAAHVSMAIAIGLLAGGPAAMAQGVGTAPPAATPQAPATVPPPRPVPPTRDPNTPGYVTAKELPDGTVPPSDAEGNVKEPAIAAQGGAMKRWGAALLGASAVTLAGSSTATVTPSAVAAEVTRQVYISAVDSTGAPVTDLTAADVAVKENGKERSVASLQPAVAPMHVAILVEDGGLGSFQYGVGQFLQRSIGHGQFSITLLTPQASPVVDFTDDAAALKSALGRLGMRGRVQTDGDQMLDAIARAAKALQQRNAERPIILALTVAGGQPQSIEPTDVLTTLRSSRAALNVLFVTGADVGMVLGDGPRQSGGRIEQAGTGAAIAASLVKIADTLQRQYLLTYTLPDGVKPSERLSVSTSRKGITLTAPSRIATK